MIIAFLFSAALQQSGPALTLGLPMGFYSTDDKPCEAGAPNFDNLTRLAPRYMEDFALSWEIVSVQPVGANRFLVKEGYSGNEEGSEDDIAISEVIYTVLSPTSFSTSAVGDTAGAAEERPVFRYCDQSRLPPHLWE